MKNKIKILLAGCCFLFSTAFATAQTNCDTDVDFLSPESDLTEDFTEINGNTITANIEIASGREVIFGFNSGLLLTAGLHVEQGGILETTECTVGNGNIPELTHTLHVTPNPTTGSALAELKLDAAADLNLILFSPLGKIVKTFAGGRHYAAGLHTFDLQLDDLPNGIYILQITDGIRASSRKIVKQ